MSEETETGERLSDNPFRGSEPTQWAKPEHVKPIRRKRMTKNDVKQYVEWTFSDSIKDEIPNWNNKQIITEYEKLTGKKLSHQFISAQRNKWQLINGEVVRNGN